MRPDSFIVRPCDQLSFQEEAGFRLQTPWLALELELSESARDQLRLWQEKGLESSDDCQPVFRELLRYPVCYSLPRPTIGDVRRLDAIAPLPEALLQRIQSLVPSAADMNPALNGEGHVDALALLTQHRIRRFARRSARSLASQARLDHVRQKAEAQPQAYETFLCNLTAQGLCVTQKGLQALAAAATQWTEATEVLQAYHDEETGHDRLVQNSLSGFAQAQPDEGSLRVVQDVMDLFFYAAQNSLLAFLMSLDVFECIPYTEGDLGLWDIQDALNPTSTSAGIRRHRAINQAGQHFDVAFDLVQTFSWFDANEGALAWAIAEAIDQSLLENFYRQFDQFMSS